jgi:hypothetical protein
MLIPNYRCLAPILTFRHFCAWIAFGKRNFKEVKKKKPFDINGFFFSYLGQKFLDGNQKCL